MTQDHDSLPAPTDGPSAIDLLPVSCGFCPRSYQDSPLGNTAVTYHVVLCTVGMSRLSYCHNLLHKHFVEPSWGLQEEILARIVGLLQPCQLHWVERVNTRLRKTGRNLLAVCLRSILSNAKEVLCSLSLPVLACTVVRNNLWREHCKKACHNFEHLVAGVDAEVKQPAPRFLRSPTMLLRTSADNLTSTSLAAYGHSLLMPRLRHISPSPRLFHDGNALSHTAKLQNENACLPWYS